MNYYLDIQMRPSLEFSEHVLMDEVYFRLHKVMGKFGEGKVGVSFPKVNKTLGACLRLHADKSILEKMMSTSWAHGIEDHIIISSLNPIPEAVSYRIVKRIQIKSSTERVLRRSVRKGWITAEEADLRLANSCDKSSSLPFLNLKSMSTGQKFPLFIEHGPILKSPEAGEFSSYGLSSNATIPWF